MPAILQETVVSLNEICKRAPSGRGVGPSHTAHRTTVLRWIIHGVKVKGVLVKLEAERVGGRWVTSLEAYERFVEVCGHFAGRTAAPDQERERTPAEIRRASEAAEKELEKLLRRAK